MFEEQPRHRQHAHATGRITVGPISSSLSEHLAAEAQATWAARLHGAAHRVMSAVWATGRRLFDIVFAVMALVATAPLMVALVIAVKASSPGPLFFSHERIGRHGGTFHCLKFRTMRSDAEEVLAALLASRPDLACEFQQTQKLRDDPRITPVGRLLRHWSLDELPQFVNVLLGHMSVVGPRPVTAPELARYGDDVPELLSIRPGLTGLWQVSGRSDTSFEDRVALDIRYVRERSAAMDGWILGQTIVQLLRPNGRGAY